MKIKKLLIYLLTILILAGAVIVALKGFNVDLMLQKHDSIIYVVGKDFDREKIKNISKEVFKNKKVILKDVEVFNDAISINVSNITEQEKDLLISKLDEKYKDSEKTEDIQIITKPQIRLRQIVSPYILPTIISFVLIYIIEEIKFYRKIKKSYLKILESVLVIIVSQLVLLSIIAICRIPISIITIPVLLIIAVMELIIFFEYQENKIKKQNV